MISQFLQYAKKLFSGQSYTDDDERKPLVIKTVKHQEEEPMGEVSDKYKRMKKLCWILLFKTCLTIVYNICLFQMIYHMYFEYKLLQMQTLAIEIVFNLVWCSLAAIKLRKCRDEKFKGICLAICILTMLQPILMCARFHWLINSYAYNPIHSHDIRHVYTGIIRKIQ